MQKQTIGITSILLTEQGDFAEKIEKIYSRILTNPNKHIMFVRVHAYVDIYWMRVRTYVWTYVSVQLQLELKLWETSEKHHHWL